MESVLFYMFSALAIGLITLMIFHPNPIASAMCLVGAFFGLAGLYVMLNATFVAVLQILVYAGAVMVLFMFVIMLLKLKKEDLAADRFTFKKIFYVIVGLVFLGFLIVSLLSVPAIPFKALPEAFGQAQSVGRLMFTTYLIPFELISILILIAILGVVLLGKRKA
jgi:NADH-quinone oxidoreductase subunit J